LTEAATKAGFSTLSAHARHILMREVDGQSTGPQIEGMEHKTIATIVDQSTDTTRNKPRRPYSSRSAAVVPPAVCCRFWPTPDHGSARSGVKTSSERERAYAVVARGEVAIGFQQVSEPLPAVDHTARS
jgi:hypothetical protein